VAANVAFTLAIYGHHLATGAGNPAIVTIGNVALNGVPASACHLDVTVPQGELPPGPYPVVVSPGSWIKSSGPVTLVVQ
jgi:hypothetical protein